MSAELFSSTSIEVAREQFERIGHVGLTGLYDPAMAGQAISDAAAISRRASPRSGGEQTTTLRTMPREGREEALHAIVHGIHNGAALLGRDLNVSGRGEKPFLLVIEMDRDTKGPLHRDRVLSDIVAVTTLRGKSRLWYEDGSEYELTPGLTVFHDFDRQLLHQGSTGPEDRRTVLVVGKTAGRRFSLK